MGIQLELEDQEVEYINTPDFNRNLIEQNERLQYENEMLKLQIKNMKRVGMKLTYEIDREALDGTLCLYCNDKLVGEFVYCGDPQSYVDNMRVVYDMGCQITADQYKDDLDKLKKYKESAITKERNNWLLRMEEVEREAKEDYEDREDQRLGW